MTTLQIKNKLIRSIKSVENPEVLEDLYRLLNIEVENIEKLKVPSHVKKSILLGQKDIREGRYLSNEQANDEIDQWLKK
jgi:hypothetical protein